MSSEEHLVWFNVFRGAAGNAALFEIRVRMVAECVPALAPKARGGSITELKAALVDRLSPDEDQRARIEEAFALHAALLTPDFEKKTLVEWLKDTAHAEVTQQSAQIFTEGIKVLDGLLKAQSH